MQERSGGCGGIARLNRVARRRWNCFGLGEKKLRIAGSYLDSPATAWTLIPRQLTRSLVCDSPVFCLPRCQRSASAFGRLLITLDQRADKMKLCYSGKVAARWEKESERSSLSFLDRRMTCLCEWAIRDGSWQREELLFSPVSTQNVILFNSYCSHFQLRVISGDSTDATISEDLWTSCTHVNPCAADVSAHQKLFSGVCPCWMNASRELFWWYFLKMPQGICDWNPSLHPGSLTVPAHM